MRNILIMEDDEKLAAALAIRLEGAGHQVRRASNGFEGLKLILRERPDVIITDLWMPVGLGLSVIERLKELNVEPIPFICITADRKQRLRKAAQKLGAVAVFEKPFDAGELIAAIEGLEARKTENPLTTASSTERAA